MQRTTPADRCAPRPIFCDVSETYVHAFENYIPLPKLKPVELSKFWADYTETIQEKLPP